MSCRSSSPTPTSAVDRLPTTDSSGRPPSRERPRGSRVGPWPNAPSISPPPPRGRPLERLPGPDEAAGDVAGGVHRPDRPGLRPRAHAPDPGADRRACIAVGAGPRAPEHVVRRRHRRADATHPGRGPSPPAGSRRPTPWPGHRPLAVLGDADGHGRQLVGRGPAAFTILFYAVVYTLWLKRATPQNIVIGGPAGALPPVVGWAAATDGAAERLAAVRHHLHLDPAALLGPALYTTRGLRQGRRADDARGQGRATTRRQILAYSVALALAACSGVHWPRRTIYLAVSALGGAGVPALASGCSCQRGRRAGTGASGHLRGQGRSETRATCSPSPSSICSPCSRRSWWSTLRPGCWSDEASPTHRRTERRPRPAGGAAWPWRWRWSPSPSLIFMVTIVKLGAMSPTDPRRAERPWR